jgi:hypothetical protein
LASLIALSLSRLEEASAAFGGTASEFGPVWLIALAAGVGMVVLLWLVMAPVLSLEAANAVLDTVRPLPDVLYRVIAVVMLRLTQVIFAVIEAAYGLLTRAFGEPESMFRAQESEIATEQVLPFELDTSGVPRWVLDLIRITLVAIGALLVAVWLSRALRRYEDRAEGEGRASRESALSATRVLDDLIGALKSAAGELGLAVERVRSRPQGVRALYSQLINLMEEHGLGRAPQQTPFEYEQIVASYLADRRDDVARLTEGYVSVRYGEEETDARNLAALTEAWHRIRESAEARLAT